MKIERIGLIADVHANLHGLEAVLQRLSGEVDEIICAGDVTGYYARPAEALDALVDAKVRWIAGNHDRFLTLSDASSLPPLIRASIEFTKSALTPLQIASLAAAPVSARYEFGGHGVAVYHGSPWHPEDEYIYPDRGNWADFEQTGEKLIVLGHTHRPMVVRAGKTLVINPGSCGQPRDGDPRAAYAILDLVTSEVRHERVEYNIEAACGEIRQFAFAEQLQHVLRTGCTR